MVYERELAVNGATRHELGGLDGHVSGGVVGAGQEEAAHRHQAGQTGRFPVRGVALRVQLAAQPAAHVPGAVEGTVPVGVYKHSRSWGKCPDVPQSVKSAFHTSAHKPASCTPVNHFTWGNNSPLLVNLCYHKCSLFGVNV